MPSAAPGAGEGDLGVVTVVLGDDAGVAQDLREPPDDGRPALEHGATVLVGRGAVVGQQRPQLVELLQIEVPEVGVLEPADRLRLGCGVHGLRVPSAPPRARVAAARR